MAQQLCMMPRALPRCFSGHVSLTSVAPLAHSPPMPMPSSTRNAANCHTFCAKPHANVNTEYRRMLKFSARVRPSLSARTPNNSPPIADAASVSDAIRPPVSRLRPKSWMTAVRIRA